MRLGPAMNKKLLSLVIAVLSFIPIAANALEIPLMNWERGRVQEVVLGDSNTDTNWKLQLIGKGVPPIQFLPSGKNDAGYMVYSAEIPATYPLGPYSLETSGGNSPSTMVAGVNLIEATKYDIRKSLGDLSFVVALISFITVTFSALRSKKYAKLVAVKEQNFELDELSRRDAFSKIIRRLINLRKELTREIKPSLFKHLLQQESETLFKLSRAAYFALPLIGIVGGYWMSSNATTNKGIGYANLFIFVAIACLGLIDSFSGIVAMCAFWFIEFFNGNVGNLTQILIMLALGITWAGPALFSRVYLETMPRDLTGEKFKALANFREPISIAGSALVAVSLFFGGFKLLASLVVDVDPKWSPNLLHLGVVLIVALIKGIFHLRFIAQESVISGVDDFEVARVASPTTAFIAFAATYGFVYVWTGSALNSLIASLIFAAPYFLLFIRFEKVGISTFAKLPRNLFLESALVAVISLVIFKQVQALPQLADQKAEIFLIIAAIPVLLHGIYSSICDSAVQERTLV